MINHVLVKQLRDQTAAGLMDCKKALIETNGDLTKAIDWLRVKGLAAAAKKAGRTAAEGVTAVKVQDNIGVIIELNSETDFVARNEKFQQLVNNIIDIAFGTADLESLISAKMSTGQTVQEKISEHVGIIGENLNLRRMNRLTVSQGIITSYVHNPVAAGQGKISVLLALESTASDQNKLAENKLAEVGRKIAIHIAASNPYAIDVDSLDPALIERERNIFIEQSKDSGKPSNIIDQMVEGRIRKFLAEAVLLQQNFLFDDKLTIAQLLKKTGDDLGAEIKITQFIRYELGDGIIQEEKNFADEVAAVVRG